MLLRQVTLISPFVGRILDWYKKNGLDAESVDPGVKRVREVLTLAAVYAAKHNCKVCSQDAYIGKKEGEMQCNF